MDLERALGKVEDFFDLHLNSLNEAIFYKRAESVGTIRIVNVLPYHLNKEYDMLFLDFGPDIITDESAWIYRIPKGLVKKDQIVEIFVKRERVPSDPERWLVSLRPFNRAVKGRSFEWDEEKLERIFGYNEKNSETSPRFFKKFLE